MKKQWLGAFGVALVAAVLAVASVPVAAEDLQCKVPFRFQVGGAALPAGTYTVSTAQSTVGIRGFATGAFALANRIEKRTDDAPKLVFHRYGDEYILREVWTGRTGKTLVESRHERELKRREVAGFEVVVIPFS
jgi:hypothetical protein